MGTHRQGDILANISLKFWILCGQDLYTCTLKGSNFLTTFFIDNTKEHFRGAVNLFLHHC